MTSMSDDVERSTAEVHRRDAARTVRSVLVLAVLAVLVAFAIDNRGDTRVGYLWDDATFPLWAVIVGSAIGGALVSGLLRFRSRHRSP